MFIPIRAAGIPSGPDLAGSNARAPSLINGVQSCLAPQLFARSDSSLVVALLNSLITNSHLAHRGRSPTKKRLRRSLL